MDDNQALLSVFCGTSVRHDVGMLVWQQPGSVVQQQHPRIQLGYAWALCLGVEQLANLA